MLLIFFILWAVANLALIGYSWVFELYSYKVERYFKYLNLGMLALFLVGSTTMYYLEKLIQF